MKRFAVVATLVGVSLAALETTTVLAQKAPEMKPLLAGRKVEQAFKGQADVQFIPSSRKNGGSAMRLYRGYGSLVRRVISPSASVLRIVSAA